MVTITYGNILNDNFMSVLAKLVTAKLDWPDTCKLTLLSKEVIKQRAKAAEQLDSLRKRYGADAAEKEKMNEALKALDQVKFEVKIAPFDPAKLFEAAKLTTQDLILVENLLMPIPEGPTPVAQ